MYIVLIQALHEVRALHTRFELVNYESNLKSLERKRVIELSEVLPFEVFIQGEYNIHKKTHNAYRLNILES